VVPSIDAANAPVIAIDDAAAMRVDLKDLTSFLDFDFVVLLLPDK
jgi:hypothetical protein